MQKFLVEMYRAPLVLSLSHHKKGPKEECSSLQSGLFFSVRRQNAEGNGRIHPGELLQTAHFRAVVVSPGDADGTERRQLGILHSGKSSQYEQIIGD